MTEQQAQVPNEWQLPPSALLANDPLLKCLTILTRHFNHPFSEETLAAGLPLEKGRLTPDLFGRAAERAGLNSKLVHRALDKISPLTLPAVLLLNEQRACVLRAVNKGGGCEIINPDTGGVTQTTLAALNAEYTGHVILVHQKLRFDARTELSAVPRVDHWFWGVIGQAWPIYAEVLLAALLINIFALVTPLYTMNVYDRVVPNDTTETLWALTIGVLVVMIFDVSMRMLRGYLVDIAGKRIDVILSANIFERSLGIRMEARPQSVGSFASNVQEFESFREFITSATLTALVDMPFVFIFIIAIFMIGGWLALVPLVTVPIVIVVSLILQRQLGAVIQESFRCGAQKQGVLIESLSAVETIKSMSAEGVQQRRWEQLVGQVSKLSLKSKTLSQGIINSSQFLQQVAGIIIVVFGVYLINDRVLTVGALVACTMLNARALAPLGQVAGLLARYHQSAASLRTLNNVMNLPVERPANKSFVHRPVIVGSIEFREVTFTYPGHKVPALANVSFKIAAGERVGLIGRIGSGKSTIEKLILGLYKPESGSILVDGVDVNQIDPATLRRNIGYVPQDIVLFFGTVKENILYASPYAEDAAMLRAAEIAGVTEFIHPSEQGFDLPIGERGEGLSGGQRQSVAIARALVLDPPMLILDEPTNSLDNRSEENFKTRLSTAITGKTFLLVTHRASLLTLVPRLIVMDGGKIVADGPKEQVMQALAEEKSMSQEAKPLVATAPSQGASPEALSALPMRVGGWKLLKGLFTELSPSKIGKSVAREQDLEYMSETAAAALQGPPQSTHVVLWGALLFIIAFFVWAAFANIGETTVGEGRVIPSGQIQVVQNLEGGIVSEIKVKVGDAVKKNDTLLVIDDTRYKSSATENTAKDSALMAKIARLSAEVGGRSFTVSAAVARANPDLVQRERDLYNTRQAEFAANTAALRQQIDQRSQEIVEKRGRVKQISSSLAILNKTIAMMRPVVKDGAMSEIELLAKEREANDLKGELDSTNVNIPRLEGAVAEARNKLQSYEAKFRADAMAELNQARAEQQGTEATGIAMKDRVERAVVRSPVNGTIKTVKIATVGGVIQPGSDIVEIVPSEESLVIEARVKPKDIAFLRPQQDALVKLTAYDFSVYGGFPAKLEYIGADSVMDEKKQDSYYLVRVRTTSNEPRRGGKALSIIPGMTATVHIQTGEKTFLQYLLKPIIKTRELAFRER